MDAEKTVQWLNERDPLNEWSVDDDLFCLHCDGVFKAQDVFRDKNGDPNCPVCKNSSPLDFHSIPWWREDLTSATEGEDEFGYEWKGTPITAESGKPKSLPPRA